MCDFIPTALPNTTWPSTQISSSIFLGEPFGSLMYRSKLSANRCNFTSAFPIYILLNSLSCLMSSTSSTLLNSSGESEHPCLILHFSGAAFCFPPFSVILAESYLHVGMIVCRHFFRCPIFLRLFIMRGCEIVLNVFSIFIDIIIRLLFFSFHCITLVDLDLLNHPSMPGTHPTCSG